MNLKNKIDNCIKINLDIFLNTTKKNAPIYEIWVGI